MTKNTLGVALFDVFDFYFHTTVQHQSQSRNSSKILEAGMKQRPWRSAIYWLAPYGLLTLISYMPQDHLPGGGANSQWGQKCPTHLPVGNMDRDSFSFDVP